MISGRKVPYGTHLMISPSQAKDVGHFVAHFLVFFSVFVMGVLATVSCHNRCLSGGAVRHQFLNVLARMWP